MYEKKRCQKRLKKLLFCEWCLVHQEISQKMMSDMFTLSVGIDNFGKTPKLAERLALLFTKDV